MKKDKAKEQRDFPEKKDLFYIIFFLIVVVVVLFVVKFEDPKFLVDQLSLGATLFSILLAVMAILISFIQSSESSKQSMQITKEISDQSGKIGTLSDQYARFIEEQRKSNEETGEKVLKTLERAEDIPAELKQEVKQVISEANEKQSNAILNFENSIGFPILKQKEYNDLMIFIAKNYRKEQTISTEKLQSDFEDDIGYKVSKLDFLLYLHRLESKGIGKFVFTSINNGNMQSAFIIN